MTDDAERYWITAPDGATVPTGPFSVASIRESLRRGAISESMLAAPVGGSTWFAVTALLSDVDKARPAVGSGERWYVARDGGDVVGPVEAELLTEGVTKGKVPPDAQVCREGTNDWISVGRFVQNQVRASPDNDRTIVSPPLFEDVPVAPAVEARRGESGGGSQARPLARPTIIVSSAPIDTAIQAEPPRVVPLPSRGPQPFNVKLAVGGVVVAVLVVGAAVGRAAMKFTSTTEPRASAPPAATRTASPSAAVPALPPPAMPVPPTPTAKPVVDPAIVQKCRGKRDAAACRAACDGADAGSCGVAADLLWKAENKADSIRFATLGCDGGDGHACWSLGAKRERPVLSATDAEEAAYKTSRAKLNKRACELGDGNGCFSFSSNLREGYGVVRDSAESDAVLKKALTLLPKACDGGDASSCLSLGFLYELGRRIPKDLVKAKTCFEKACKAGEEMGCVGVKRLVNP